MFEILGNFGDFIGGIAVVITLLYLSYQIRQNTKEVRNSSIQSLLERSTSLFSENMDSPIAAICAKMDRGEELDHEEQWRLMMFIRRNFQLYELVFIQHQGCRISDQVMQAYERRILASMDRPFWRDMWQDMKQFYTDDFVDYINTLEAIRKKS